MKVLIEYNGKKIESKQGENLRKALIKANCSPHNGRAQWLNCRGMGTCGTCAVEPLEGELPPLKARENWRLNFPPHKAERGLRLACQLKVLGPLKLKKHQGFWGEKITK